MPTPIITALHRLPFDQARFDEECEMVNDHRPDQAAAFKSQFRENWDNAWLVVIEFPGPAEDLDFDAFAYPQPGPNAQVPWLEQILDAQPNVTGAAFFMHYLDPKQAIYYGSQPLPLPPLSPAPPGLIGQMQYESPD